MDKPKKVTVRKKADRRVAPPRPPKHHEVAKRAFELYEARGKKENHELDDWLQAERELSDRR